LSLTSELEQVQKENRDFATIYKLFERKGAFRPSTTLELLAAHAATALASARLYGAVDRASFS